VRSRRALVRLRREESGFTLPEVLVAMVMMVTVLFALYSIFDMSLRVFSFGNDKVEAVENARVGLERMEREIRAAQDDDQILDTWSPNAIEFQHEGLEGLEQVTYSVYQTGTGDYAVGRSVGDDGNNEAVAEYVDYQGSSDTGLEFKYFDENMQEINPDTGSESEVDIVRIELAIERQGVQEQDATQTLTTDVHLRNREGEGGTAADDDDDDDDDN